MKINEVWRKAWIEAWRRGLDRYDRSRAANQAVADHLNNKDSGPDPGARVAVR